MAIKRFSSLMGAFLLATTTILTSIINFIPVGASATTLDVSVLQGNINDIYNGTATVLTPNVSTGDYETSSSDRLGLKFSLKNYAADTTYFVSFKNLNDPYASSSPRSINTTFSTTLIDTIMLSSSSATTSYAVALCTEYTCAEPLYEDTVDIKFLPFDEISTSNATLYVEEVTQGGREITPTLNGAGLYYELNNTEEIKIKLKGANFIDDFSYNTFSGINASEIARLGSEINTGYTLTFTTADLAFTNGQFSPYVNIPALQNCTYLVTGTHSSTDYQAYFITSADETVNNFTANFGYANHPDETPISEAIGGNFAGSLFVETKYHDESNPLTLKINGTNYAGDNIPVSVKITREGFDDYEKSFDAVSGATLNAGHTVTLSDFTAEFPTEINYAYYTVNITVGSILKQYGLAATNSVTSGAVIKADVFYETGKKLLVGGGMGASGAIFSGHTDVSVADKNTLGKDNPFYLHYYATACETGHTYTYAIKYSYSEGQLRNPDPANIKGTTLVATGTATCEELKNKGVWHEAINTNNYEYPIFTMSLSIDGMIIHENHQTFDSYTSPVITGTEMIVNDKNLYLKVMSEYGGTEYLAVKNTPIKISLTGANFDDETTYKLNVTGTGTNNPRNPNGYWESDYVDDFSIPVTFTGAELNSGTATVEIPVSELNFTAEKYSVGFNFEDYSVTAVGGIVFRFVESSDYFPTDVPYFITDAASIIKGIKKQTSASDFADSLNVKDGGSAKVFKQDGTTEHSGNVGTGMIARVYDQYDVEQLDYDIVVKGDTSGDGDITITDLLKIANHVAENQDLEGVYKEAATITNNDISITDVTKIANDIAEIEEIK